jgi:hypothetical protein
MEVKTFESPGINWVHYLRVQFVDASTVDVLSHYRMHKSDSGHPKTFGDFTLVKDIANNYRSVLIDRKEYRIREYKER